MSVSVCVRMWVREGESYDNVCGEWVQCEGISEQCVGMT